jgi:hypothetical protein
MRTARVTVGLVLVGIYLSACRSSPGHRANHAGSSQPGVVPTVIIPKSVGGTSGQGPIFVSNPGQPISLPDRTIAIVSFSERFQKSNKAEFVDVSITITNSGQNPISNQPRYFQLIGQGGDIFSYQDNSSDTFYSPIDPQTSRTGLIEFEIPGAAAKGLELLYRPDVASDAVIARLNFA